MSHITLIKNSNKTYIKHTTPHAPETGEHRRAQYNNNIVILHST
jgi:hypothetical protein